MSPAIQTTAPKSVKRLSPEIMEVLKMLNAIESRNQAEITTLKV